MNAIKDIYLTGIVGDVNGKHVGKPLRDVSASIGLRHNESHSDLFHCEVEVISSDGDEMFFIELTYKVILNDVNTSLDVLKEILPEMLQGKIENAIAFIGLESGQSDDWSFFHIIN